jgi:integrase
VTENGPELTQPRSLVRFRSTTPRYRLDLRPGVAGGGLDLRRRERRRTGGRGGAAKFTFPVHSHMLRHACGFKLANDRHDTRAIQAYLGHRSIMSTVRYTALTPNRFKHFWKD